MKEDIIKLIKENVKDLSQQDLREIMKQTQLTAFEKRQKEVIS